MPEQKYVVNICFSSADSKFEDNKVRLFNKKIKNMLCNMNYIYMYNIYLLLFAVWPRKYTATQCCVSQKIYKIAFVTKYHPMGALTIQLYLTTAL